MVSRAGTERPRWTSSSFNIVRCFPWDSLVSVLVDITRGIWRAWPLRIRQNKEEGWGLEQPVLRSRWTAFLLAAAPKQRPLPICRAQSVALVGLGVQLTVFPNLRPCTKGHAGLWCPCYYPVWAGEQLLSPAQQLSIASIPSHQEAWLEDPGSHRAHSVALLGQRAKLAALLSC